MRQFTTKRLLVATFWFGVAFACFVISSPSAYLIAFAGLAVSYAILMLTGPIGSERKTFTVMIIVMLLAMLLFGITLAIQGR
jgi:hypothetical protein